MQAGEAFLLAVDKSIRKISFTDAIDRMYTLYYHLVVWDSSWMYDMIHRGEEKGGVCKKVKIGVQYIWKRNHFEFW